MSFTASLQLVKYHMIRLSCENSDVLALTEDQLITSSMEGNLASKDIELIYTIDRLLQRRVYIFIKYKWLSTAKIIHLSHVEKMATKVQKQNVLLPWYPVHTQLAAYHPESTLHWPRLMYQVLKSFSHIFKCDFLSLTVSTTQKQKLWKMRKCWGKLSELRSQFGASWSVKGKKWYQLSWCAWWHR